jgi:hypothetical protein
MTNPNTTSRSKGVMIRNNGTTSKSRERQWASTEIREVMGYKLPRLVTQHEWARQTSPRTVTSGFKMDQVAFSKLNTVIVIDAAPPATTAPTYHCHHCCHCWQYCCWHFHPHCMATCCMAITVIIVTIAWPSVTGSHCQLGGHQSHDICSHRLIFTLPSRSLLSSYQPMSISVI